MQSRCRFAAILGMACLTSWLLLAAGCPITPVIRESHFKQTNLVSNGSQTAAFVDTNLVNPWGIAQGPATALWVSDNAKGLSTVYNGSGQPFPVGGPLIVTIPAALGGTTPAPPTGVVFNSFAGTGDFGGSTFIFVTEDGTIATWQQSNGTTAVLAVNNFIPDTGPVYKGATLVTNGQGNFLLVADFRNARIAVFDRTLKPVTLTGLFADSAIPTGFAPFNVQVLNGKVYVSYALQDDKKHDDVSGVGNGFVNEFDTSGTLVRRIAGNGDLNSPWGLALGPSSWNKFAGSLIVGNFGDGKIHAFTLGTTPASQARSRTTRWPTSSIRACGRWCPVPAARAVIRRNSTSRPAGPVRTRGCSPAWNWSRTWTSKPTIDRAE